MSLIKAEIEAFRRELQAILPMMVAEAVRQELDARGIVTGSVVTQEVELKGDGTGTPLPPATASGGKTITRKGGSTTAKTTVHPPPGT